MEIQCPTAKTNVLVSGQGSGSGGTGTICVRGVVTDQDGVRGGLPTTVRVVVVAGWVTPPPPDPDSGGIDVTPIGQGWCARNVPVPGSSTTGVQCTAVAWFKTGSSGWSDPAAVWFYAGGPNPVDCCTGCGPGPGSSAPAPGFDSWPPPPPPFPANITDGPK